MQQQDLYTFPYESYLYVEEKLTKNKVIDALTWHWKIIDEIIVDEIRYELNEMEINRNRNVA